MKSTSSKRTLTINQTLKVVDVKDHILSMSQVFMLAVLAHAILELVLSPKQERVTTGTKSLKLHFGLLNASATHFSTSGHTAPSFLQVL